MQKHINMLEALYYGEITPWEKHFERDPEFTACAKIILDSEKILFSSLNEDNRQTFSQLMEADSRLSSFSELEYFIEGFRLGAAFMLDTFIIPQKSAVIENSTR